MVDPRSSEGLPPKTEWRTPLEVFNWIQELYGLRFDLDPCTSEDNNLGTEYFYTPRTNGLTQSWRGRKVFVNPPYGREIGLWIDKAIEEVEYKGGGSRTEIVMLLPSATDTLWFKKIANVASLITFITRRIQFEGARGSARGGYLFAYLDSYIQGDTSFDVVDLLGGVK